MLDSLMAKKRVAGIALILALGATGVACEGKGDVDVEGEGNGGEEGGEVDVDANVGEEGGEGEEGGD